MNDSHFVCHAVRDAVNVGLSVFVSVSTSVRNSLPASILGRLVRYVVKNLEKPSSSVDHGCKKLPTFLFENLSAVSIVRHKFAGNFIPPNVLGEWPGTEKADAIVPAPEGGVGDEDGRVRYEILFWNRDGVELFAYPDM